MQLPQLDTPTGHMSVCLLLMLFALIYRTPESHDLYVFAIGVLSRSMVGKGGTV